MFENDSFSVAYGIQEYMFKIFLKSRVSGVIFALPLFRKSIHDTAYQLAYSH